MQYVFKAIVEEEKERRGRKKKGEKKREKRSLNTAHELKLVRKYDFPLW